MNGQAAPLLARYAESLFWMARYMERLENLARLIDVTQTFESPGLENEAWDALVRIHADETHFADTYGSAEPDTVKRYYLLDTSNANSIRGSIEGARMNARTLRPLISTEMWKHLNVFHRDLLEIQEHELHGDSLSRLCTRIKEGVQAHTGITEGTLFSRPGLAFLRNGPAHRARRPDPRACSTSSFIVWHRTARRRSGSKSARNGAASCAPSPATTLSGASPRVDFGPQHVVAFLLADPCFPTQRPPLPQPDGVASEPTAHQLRAARHAQTAGAHRGYAGGPAGALGAEKVIESGLHEFLDGMQRDLITLAGDIGTAFFRDWRPNAQPPVMLQSQAQTVGTLPEVGPAITP